MTHYSWLIFALGTVACWGLYGIFLHEGQLGMADAVNGRYKAFLWVGIAYFLTAVLAPLLVLVVKGATWSFPGKGMWLSLVAGILGAIGAFCVLLALGAGVKHGTGPSVIMSIVFAGAPVVNAVVALSLHPPQGGLSAIRWPFFLGIILAAVGGCLVTLFKPGGPPPKKPAESAHVASTETSEESG
ncbi:MAG: hypothetical protein AAGD22_13905 [Verrucomicrobiota bacterium]